LLKGGADLSFLVRPKRAAQLAEQGLIVKSPGGDIKRPVKAMLSGEIDGYYVMSCCSLARRTTSTAQRRRLLPLLERTVLFYHF
jgi:hypothetical protein